MAFLTLIILFSEILNLQKLFFPNQKKYCEGLINSEYLRIFSFVEMSFSKLINYSTGTCVKMAKVEMAKVLLRYWLNLANFLGLIVLLFDKRGLLMMGFLVVLSRVLGVLSI